MFIFVVVHIIIGEFVQLVMHIHIYISMALSTMNTTILGYCEIDLKLNGHDYKNVRLSLLKDLCSDVILVHDF